MPQLTTSLIGKNGAKWTYAIGVTDLYFDYISPSLRAVGIEPGGYPRAISAGDGSVSAFERIRSGEYQIATVAEPLNEQGWQAIDEANRAISGSAPSGYISPVHLITKKNIEADGGDRNVYDPANGYQDIYKKIWGVQ
jgi:ribose transport system substrate-binding protein